MVNTLFKSGALLFALAIGGLDEVHSVNLGFRPNPESQPWANKEQTREAFENSPWESVKAQE